MLSVDSHKSSTCLKTKAVQSSGGITLPLKMETFLHESETSMKTENMIANSYID